ncbi:probable glycosyltransferase At3g07620 [Olea europaea subsp. europaea]|uniref:Probable glycosyltransferase At3g07620 n=1 Tax=Olea europaea subsp. europaea TaxID=158383 RepID=A0A8S0QVM4_OLEEU|nr:probable glycosyltransferase At3g07620 [Olea europaea subsp. europaea]
MDYSVKIQTLLQIEKRKWLFLVGLVALTHLFCQSLMLPYGSALMSLLPSGEKASKSSNQSPFMTVMPENAYNIGISNANNASLLVGGVKYSKSYHSAAEAEDNEVSMVKDEERRINIASDSEAMDNDFDFDFDFVEDETLDNDNPFQLNRDMEEGFKMQHEESQEHGSKENMSIIFSDANTRTMQDESSTVGTPTSLPLVVSQAADLLIKSVVETNSGSRERTSTDFAPAVSLKTKKLSDGKDNSMLQNKFSVPSNGSLLESKPVKKKMRCEMPPKTVMLIDEMQRLLVRHRARSRAMRPRWSSERDQEILRAKLQIENAPVLKNGRDLYAPVFRNISMFKRSYELMERLLKIYVYKEGEKPIFHQPVLKGLYASEGWFMKLMEGNKHFVVKDPRKAHLFYMPFSSRMLEYTLYVRNSHNRTNLRQYLKNYSEKIAAKYRFWNRTGGADHFLVACHDWAPYETRHHMEHCIKALCNADITMGFKIGRDISLPETYVRSARNPLRDIGGKPSSQRHILAFYAGNMHGYLRPILLDYWKDKDPDMKIFGPMPPGVASKMNYIQHMKSSKYCICPKGYEVNSPRVVEAIFYECVPVIISDNFVPPFFEVLNWDAFSVIIAENDIPNLKNILMSIPGEKYNKMQLGVKKVQRHFLWHANPAKYDLFHMTLHSIWYNRVFQIKLR